MTLAVVDHLEAVDVDECQHEAGARTVRTLELARHFLETEPAREGARQLVRRRELQAVCRFRAVPKRFGAFTGCLCPIGCRSCPVAFGPQKNVLPTRIHVVLQIVQTSQSVTTLSATITK